MSADRVAEALAVLETAEKEATPGRWGWDERRVQPNLYKQVVVGPIPFDVNVALMKGPHDWVADAEFIAKFRNAAPALLTLAGAANEVLDGGHHHLRHQKCNYCGMTWPCPMSAVEEALAELAEAVLGA